MNEHLSVLKNPESKKIIEIYVPHITFLKTFSPESSLEERLNLGRRLIACGIPVLPRDEGMTIIGLITSPAAWNEINNIFPDATFGYSPQSAQYPLLYSPDGEIINWGSLSTIAAYRARQIQKPKPDIIFVLDPEGSYYGDKKTNLSKTDPKTILEKLDETISLSEIFGFLNYHWELEKKFLSFTYYLKIDINGSARLVVNNPGQNLLKMTNFFCNLAGFLRGRNIILGENTGESIICYPTTTESIRTIINYAQLNTPFGIKIVAVGPKSYRDFLISANGVCNFVFPATSLETVALTEDLTKTQERLFGHNYLLRL